MSMTSTDHGTRPTDEFAQMVRDALAQLHDTVALEFSPLLKYLRLDDAAKGRRPGRALRSLLLESIGDLEPRGAAPFRSIQARSFAVLNLRWIEGLMVQQVGRELAVSERQVYRDLKKAEERLALLLWMHHGTSPEEQSLPSPELADGPVGQELRRLTLAVEQIRISEVVQAAIDSVQPLARGRRVSLEASCRPPDPIIPAQPTLLREVLVSLFSCAVQQARCDTTVGIEIDCITARAVTISFQQSATSSISQRTLDSAFKLLRELDEQYQLSPDGEYRRIQFIVRVPERQKLLIIDDNEGLREMLSRYLAGQEYEILAAGNGPEGIACAEKFHPNVIVLDVMMPMEDGWQVLQRLQRIETTRDIPVIICSVLHDPELAFALGASAFLSKPVLRADIVRAIDRLM